MRGWPNHLRIAISVLVIAIGLVEESSAQTVALTGTALLNARGRSGGALTSGQLALFVIDRSGNGFALIASGGLRGGEVVRRYLVDSDDLVVGKAISEVVFGTSLIPGGVSFTLGAGVDPGDPFGILFFDGMSGDQVEVPDGASYTFVTHPTWIVPSRGSVAFQEPAEGQLQQLEDRQAASSLLTPDLSFSFWALQYGLEGVDVGALDPDQDGQANLLEYVFGTDPLAHNIWKHDFRRDPVTGSFRIEFTPRVGRVDGVVVVEGSSNLKDWSPSFPGLAIINASSGTQGIAYHVPDTIDRGFFRVSAEKSNL